MSKPITGRKVLLMFVGFFGVIVAVNFAMAYWAISTFPGLEVKNSYVASQSFDKERKAQMALGWHVDVSYADEKLQVRVLDEAGQPATVAKLSAIVTRPTHVRDDLVPEFQQRSGKFVAPLALAEGQWNLRLRITALDGTLFKQRLDFYVDG
ncbi:MAG: nitrogen fixation protein FixH [Rhodobacterales bacterium]|nr:MAG: nitrogen fixation protein FixH [Rhodobacterales bacterium]